MSLISFLLRFSWTRVAVAIFTGFVSGGSSASLIALISKTIGHSATSSSFISTVGEFVGLVIVTLITSIISQVVLIRLSQDAVFQLRMHLSRQILTSELTYLEKLGTSRLLATLTEDIQAVSNAVYVIPFLCIDIAIVIGCLIYLAWLSWVVIGMVCGFLVVVTGSCQWLLRSGERSLALAREQQDSLFSHFRSLTAGSKELKLHYQRRQLFGVTAFAV